jgi:hypothetical protein
MVMKRTVFRAVTLHGVISQEEGMRHLAETCTARKICRVDFSLFMYRTQLLGFFGGSLGD